MGNSPRANRTRNGCTPDCSTRRRNRPARVQPVHACIVLRFAQVVTSKPRNMCQPIRDELGRHRRHRVVPVVDSLNPTVSRPLLSIGFEGVERFCSLPCGSDWLIAFVWGDGGGTCTTMLKP